MKAKIKVYCAFYSSIGTGRPEFRAIWSYFHTYGIAAGVFRLAANDTPASFGMKKERDAGGPLLNGLKDCLVGNRARAENEFPYILHGRHVMQDSFAGAKAYMAFGQGMIVLQEDGIDPAGFPLCARYYE